jgi:hypothetical protein
MADGGKGSKPRPFSVDQKTFDSNWENIFGQKDKKAEESKSADDEITDHSDEDQ